MSDEQREAALETDNPVMIIAGAGSGKTRTLVGRFIHLVTPAAQGGLDADPSSVMMVTFTNKAAKEMRERLQPVMEELRAQDSSQVIRDPWVGTFHSLSLRILRIESERAGLSRNFSIFDEADARSLAEDVAEGLNMNTFDVDDFFRDLELAKSRLLSAQLLSEKRVMIDMKRLTGQEVTQIDTNWEKILSKFQTENFINLYSAYQRSLKEQNAVDFSDLMNTVTDIFRDNPHIRNSWRSTFRHFMVDEVQDMNRAQAAWMHMFTDGCRPMVIDKSEGNNADVSAEDGLHEINGYRVRKFPRPTVAFVGDDDQAIYGFRGSDISVMHDMAKRYDGVKLRYLTASYRCQPAILDVANHLIAHNDSRFDKAIRPADPDRAAHRVIIEKHFTPMEEIRALIGEASRYMGSGNDPSEFAILTRTREHVRVISKEMRAAGLPVVEGKASDIRRSAEVKDAMAFAGFLVNPDAETLLRRVINRPSRGLGPTSISRVLRNARKKNVSFIEELRSIMNGRIDLPEDAEPYKQGFINSVKDFGQLVVNMRKGMSGAKDAGEALITILEETRYLPGLRESAMKSMGVPAGDPMRDMAPQDFLKSLIHFREALRQKENAVSQKDAGKPEEESVDDLDMESLADRAGSLSETARRIGNLSILIEQARHFPDLESFIQESTLEMDQSEAQAGFRIMTIHASKGLEFDRVRLPFWNEGIMPLTRGGASSPSEIEEERRLAYVALTRARETVRISLSHDVSKSPFIRMRFTQPSSFIDEIRKLKAPVVANREIWKKNHPCYALGAKFSDIVPAGRPVPDWFEGKQKKASAHPAMDEMSGEMKFIQRLRARSNEAPQPETGLEI